MNLLIDFLTSYGRFGAGEYLRRVVQALFEHIQENNREDIRLFALYDSRIPISFEDLREENLGKKCEITYIDLQENGLLQIIEEHNIDRFFIACGQRIGEYPEIADVRCEVICVTHDLLYEEWYSNHMYQYWKSLIEKDHDNTYGFIQRIRYVYSHVKKCLKQQMKFLLDGKFEDCQGKKELDYMGAVIRMVRNNPRCLNIMVSHYSKNSMMYNFGIPEDRIMVLYSPERIESKMEAVKNEKLKWLIESEKKYYLMVSADRECKNPVKSAKAFRHYSELDKDAYFVMVGNRRQPLTDRQINMEFLSDSDLVHAMKNCYALLYPSFFEGFGYPPLEAMRFPTT